MVDISSAHKEIFRIQEVSSEGGGVYSIKLTRDAQIIVAKCSVLHITDSKIGPFDFVRFETDEFNQLCMRWDIYEKPIGKVILAFHECLREKKT